MELRYRWFKLTHGLWHGPGWLLVLGADMSDSDYGITFKHGDLPPLPGPSSGWRRWRVEWRIRFRWPVVIRRYVSK